MTIALAGHRPLATVLAMCLALQAAYPAFAQVQNPAGPTYLPPAGSSPGEASVLVPSTRQALTGDMAIYDRDFIKSQPLKFGSLLNIASMRPLAMDADYSRPISLKQALQYGMDNNLSIKISKESENYYNALFYNYLGYFAPSLSSNTSFAHANINSATNTSTSVFQNVITFPLFTGGNHYLFAVAQNYRRKGWRLATTAAREDELLAIYKKYMTLVLDHQLLRIRLKAVELAKQQLDLKQAAFKAGTATLYEIKLAKSQLETDNQALLTQQVATRTASLDLSYELNMPLNVNLVPDNLELGSGILIRGKPQINALLKVAFENRVDLKEYELFRLASARDVQIGLYNLYPTVSMFLAYTRTSLNYQGNASDLSGLAVTQIAQGGNNFANGTATNNALGQTANFSAASGSSSSSGANTSSSSSVASAGGTPQSAVQAGTSVTSGAVAPSIISPIAVGVGNSSNLNGTNTATLNTPGVFNSLQAGLSLNWSLPSSGLVAASNTVALRTLSRRALMQANQKLQQVENQVRADYTNALSVLGQIKYSSTLLDTNEEALRMAMVKLNAGLSTPAEFDQAKSTYLDGLRTEAEALINSRVAQAQLLRDIGMISIDTLTMGFSLDESVRRKKKS